MCISVRRPTRVGPDLAGVGERLTRQQMLESIVAPNRRTTPGYDATVFFLEGGEIVNGRVIEESATTARVLDADGAVIGVDLERVEERRPDLSAMPEDLPLSLTREQMRDLLAYLAGL